MNDDELRSALSHLAQDVPDDGVLPAATARRIRRRRRTKVAAGALGGAGALLTAAVLVLGAGSATQDRVVPADPPTPSPSAPASPSPSPSPVPPSPSATGDETPSGAVRVVLQPTGLGFPGGSPSSVPFGSGSATARAAVDEALGQGGEMPTAGCGPGSTTVRHEGLFLLLQDGAFVGWVSGSPGLRTADGIGVGSTLADLRAAHPDVQVTDAADFPTWRAGGLEGQLDGTDDASLVLSVRGGEACPAG